MFKGGLNILWILTLKYGFGPGYRDFQETGPWYFVFFLKTAVDQVFWLDRLNGKLEFSRAYAPDKTDFRVYSIKRRGVYCFILQKHMVSAWAFIKRWRFFFSLSYLLNFVTQYYVKGADRKKVF